MQGSYVYCIVIGFCTLVVAGSWFQTRKSSWLLNYIVIFYQLLITVGNEIDAFLSQEDRSSLEFKWFNGYLCGFAHLLVYLQGSNFIPHTVVLIVMNGVHLSTSDVTSTLGSMNLLMFLIMQGNIIAIKYYYERTKREEFVHSQQHKKWQELIQTVISNYLLLVRLDEKQDQLILVQVSKMASKHFDIEDSAKMRRFLRDLKPF